MNNSIELKSMNNITFKFNDDSIIVTTMRLAQSQAETNNEFVLGFRRCCQREAIAFIIQNVKGELI